ncbi:hypothetical protein RhiirC2_793440 [Rhizophagus irregularis]|uniref:Uncharacterized protein n=1 Tax=Rhizophagus irregularis TaxID=588596 RepID=A0A2N1MFE0_9GLOM|nr:hypothetical protein RhiirC2_793440 [Rhizophagus irregularis]
MNAVYKSGMEDEIGQGLQLKSQDKLNGRTAISGHRESTRRGQTIMDGLTDQKEILDDKIDDFNKLNEAFSDRIKEINDNKQLVFYGVVSKVFR